MCSPVIGGSADPEHPDSTEHMGNTFPVLVNSPALIGCYLSTHILYLGEHLQRQECTPFRNSGAIPRTMVYRPDPKGKVVMALKDIGWKGQEPKTKSKVYKLGIWFLSPKPSDPFSIRCSSNEFKRNSWWCLKVILGHSQEIWLYSSNPTNLLYPIGIHEAFRQV